MPRIGRAVALGYPHHIIQRGNNREVVFVENKDRKQYLSLLKKYVIKWESPVMAYCMMSNHVYLLTKPGSNESLFKMMQGLIFCYTQYIHKKYRRTGRLWESRYHSCIVDHEKYLWSVVRYIEQNPVRARMVERSEDYPYSSTRAHVSGSKDAVLGEELFDNTIRKDYMFLLYSDIPKMEIEQLRYASRTGRPLGGIEFVVDMGNKLERRLLKQSKGRPKKRT
jgi:putative transposase